MLNKRKILLSLVILLVLVFLVHSILTSKTKMEISFCLNDSIVSSIIKKVIKDENLNGTFEVYVKSKKMIMYKDNKIICGVIIENTATNVIHKIYSYFEDYGNNYVYMATTNILQLEYWKEQIKKGD